MHEGRNHKAPHPPRQFHGRGAVPERLSYHAVGRCTMMAVAGRCPVPPPLPDGRIILFFFLCAGALRAFPSPHRRPQTALACLCVGPWTSVRPPACRSRGLSETDTPLWAVAAPKRYIPSRACARADEPSGAGLSCHGVGAGGWTAWRTGVRHSCSPLAAAKPFGLRLLVCASRTTGRTTSSPFIPSIA